MKVIKEETSQKEDTVYFAQLCTCMRLKGHIGFHDAAVI